MNLDLQATKLYGFGSYFKIGEHYSDVDLLIVHPSGEDKNCEFAIKCKLWLASEIPKAHVSLLTQTEEQELGMLLKSRARFLGNIKESDLRGKLEISRNGLFRPHS